MQCTHSSISMSPLSSTTRQNTCPSRLGSGTVKRKPTSKAAGHSGVNTCSDAPMSYAEPACWSSICCSSESYRAGSASSTLSRKCLSTASVYLGPSALVRRSAKQAGRREPHPFANSCSCGDRRANSSSSFMVCNTCSSICGACERVAASVASKRYAPSPGAHVGTREADI